MREPGGLYGTEEATYYVSRSGRRYVIQSSDLVGRRGDPWAECSIPEGAIEINAAGRAELSDVTDAIDAQEAAAALGRRGRGVSKRRGDADHYRALGAQGGAAGLGTKKPRKAKA